MTFCNKRWLHDVPGLLGAVASTSLRATALPAAAAASWPLNAAQTPLPETALVVHTLSLETAPSPLPGAAAGTPFGPLSLPGAAAGAPTGPNSLPGIAAGIPADSAPSENAVRG